MVEVQGLSVNYGEVAAISNLDLAIAAGEFVLLTGPSGCGKSTLARVLSGLIPHAIPAGLVGRVAIGGLQTAEHPLPRLASTAGIVLQNPSAQLFHLCVEDEVAFGPRNLGLPEQEVQSRAAWALAATGIEHLGKRRPSALSGGEQQRVAIAAVLAMLPKLLILDEPTASLDRQGTRQVHATLRKLNQDLGMTILLIEHRLAAALPLAHRLLVMEHGRLVADGAPQGVLRDRAMCRALGLRIPGEALRPPQDRLATPLDRSRAEQTPLLRLEHVVAGYQGDPVLHGVNLALRQGECAALVGKNGSGKSTLGLVAAGLLRPKRGEVHFQGNGRPRPGRDVAMIFQNPADQIFTDSVSEEVSFGPLNFGSYDPARHQAVLAAADLEQVSCRCPTRISAGQQQRTLLAACIAMQPRLLILDEPTLGQDWVHLCRLMDLVCRLKAEGTAVLLISHDHQLVNQYAERLLFMRDGRITFDGHPSAQLTGNSFRESRL